MSGGWKNSNRRETLPDNWEQLRADQLRADGYRCVWELPSGERCPKDATDVDHYGEAWEHDKLRSLCGPHHDKRTGKQGNEAKARRVVPLRRPRERPAGEGWA